MKFVQIIEFETDRIDDMRALVEQADQQADQQAPGREGGPTHRLVLQDRGNPRRFHVLIEFASAEDAQRNSDSPETARMAEQLAALCTSGPSFTDCDVREMTELK
ncbi:hypothetical protein GCM10009837_33630 [Streptomyces durmitorensis]|uniref:Antibiotic biosynthesis monooxygenase n=1 Tax=Streptomyces durmitorensis TaxID=319947 RepID=A0ABY4Q0K0_9ACTN|nr:hypothetical protein [Streptomyces durmitorensis]UQT59240.1 hypothetical protein M4V62_31580 [Streptomyces durmitorensis]